VITISNAAQHSPEFVLFYLLNFMHIGASVIKLQQMTEWNLSRHSMLFINLLFLCTLGICVCF